MASLSPAPETAPAATFVGTADDGGVAMTNASKGTVSGSGSVGSKDLLVVGPGVLGTLVLREWRKRYPDAALAALSKTRGKCAQRLADLNVTTFASDDPSHLPSQGATWANVLFSAPPPVGAKPWEFTGGAEADEAYLADVRTAARCYWDGTGAFVYTSSTAVFDVDDGGECTEESPTVALGKGPRWDRLVRAEEIAVSVGGAVIRFGGLYASDADIPEFPGREFWCWGALKSPVLPGPPDYMMSFCHYLDAAELCCAVLAQGRKGMHVGTDDTPHTWEQLLTLIHGWGKRPGPPGQRFARERGEMPQGKRVVSTRTRDVTGWVPKYAGLHLMKPLLLSSEVAP